MACGQWLSAQETLSFMRKPCPALGKKSNQTCRNRSVSLRRERTDSPIGTCSVRAGPRFDLAFLDEVRRAGDTGRDMRTREELRVQRVGRRRRGRELLYR